MSDENDTGRFLAEPSYSERAPSPKHEDIPDTSNDHVEGYDDGCEFMECSEPPPANGMRSAPESPISHSNPASPDAQSAPESPTQDEGQVSDNDDEMEHQNYTPAEDHQQSFNGSNPHSDLENHAVEDEGEDGEHGRLDKLKDLRFKRFTAQKNARRSGDPTRKTVRSYLDEKGPDEFDVTTFAARPAKSETLRDDGREERSERKKKKKRHEDRPHKVEPMDHAEKSEPVVPVATESRPVTYNQGGNITQKVHILLTKMEESSAGNGEGESEDDVRALLLEAVFLEQELEATLEKRENLMKEMENMAETEKENIKKMHLELPTHLQGVIKVEGDNITISDGSNGSGLPPPMFPTMPSMLMDGGSGPMPHIPAIMPPFGGSNGIAVFSGILNGNRTPPQGDANDENDDEGRRGFSPSMDHSSWSQTFYSGYGSQNDKQFDDLPSYIQDVSSASITFAMPPLLSFIDADGEDPTQSYQLPPNPGAPGINDLPRTLTNFITSMVINNPGVNPPHNFGSPSQGQMGAASNSLLSGGVSSPRRNESRPNPPSLMSIATENPFNSRLAPPSNFLSVGRAGRADHVDSPR